MWGISERQIEANVFDNDYLLPTTNNRRLTRSFLRRHKSPWLPTVRKREPQR